MTGLELLPTRGTYALGESVIVEVRGVSSPGEFSVWSLGEEVLRQPYDGGDSLVVGWIPAGGYGVELHVDGQTVRTAVHVSSAARWSLRYGFAVDYSPDRDLAGISDNIRRLHLTGIQFYDWAYRHASLLGGGDNYRDALDQPISLDTVRDLIAAVQSAGAAALGYAAVYAAGPVEWPTWKHRALLDANGEPYALGDFLFLLDPASDDWLRSFTGQLVEATGNLGFDGFHLDQYGYPKYAERPDGALVDVAASFATLIQTVRDALPESRLVFNNVNDFPTWVTAHSEQDAVYIEVWDPNITLGALAKVVTRARLSGGKKPVVIAAYQHVYDSAPARESDLATAFTMATLFSHGATQLLVGEADRLLVDPYYVRNHVIEESTALLLKRWYDFLVEHDAILMDPAIVEVTGSYAGDYNADCDVSYAATAVTETPTAGAVWRRITSSGSRLVLHLINLAGQGDDQWDSPRNEPSSVGTGTVRFRRVGAGMPRVRVADPEGMPRLVDLPVILEGDYASAALPEFTIWQVVVIDLHPILSETRETP